MATKVNEMIKAAEEFNKALNEFVSESTLSLIDMAYPNHDGNADANVVADMMALRDRLYSIMNGCEIGIEHLSFIDDEEDDNDE